MRIAFDFETTRVPRHTPYVKNSFPVMLSACCDGVAVQSFVFNHSSHLPGDQGTVQAVKDLFGRATLLIGHNLKFDIHWLAALGLGTDVLNYPWYCTKVAEYLIHGQDKTVSTHLGDVSERYGIVSKIDKVAQYWDAGYETDEIPLSILQPYCEQDAINAYTIYQRQQPLIKELGLSRVVNLQMALTRELWWAEFNGMKFDVPLAQQFSAEYSARIKQIELDLSEITGYSINYDSSDQLSALLFGGSFKAEGEEWVIRTFKNFSKYYPRACVVDVVLPGLGFVPPKGTEKNEKGGYSVNANTVLSCLKSKNKKQKTVLELILERAKLKKAVSTYFDGLCDKVFNGYLHPTFNQAVTATGRLSSSNPNSQNIPRDKTAPAKQPFISRWNDV